MARNKLRKEKELNQIKKSTNVFFNIIFIILSFLLYYQRCVFFQSYLCFLSLFRVRHQYRKMDIS